METIGGWLILYLWIGAVLRDVYLRKFAAAGEPWHKSWAIVVGWFEMLTVFVALYTVALAIHKAIPASTYVRIRETSKVS